MDKMNAPITPLSVLAIVAREWRTLVGTALLGSAITFGGYLVIPKYYEASTLIMSPQQQSATTSAMSQLGALTGGTSGIKTPEEIYAALLRTRRIQSGVVKDLSLQKHYELDSIDAAALTLAKLVNVSTDKKSGLITITAADKDAQTSAMICNAYVGQLRLLLSKIAITEAQQRRKYIEEQLELAIQSYDKYETEFFREQASRGLVTSQAVAESKVKAAATVRQTIMEKEVELATIARFSTPENAERKGKEAALAALRGRLKLLEEGDPEAEMGLLKGTGASKVFRVMKAQELSVDGLLRQLQVARLDEVKDAPLIQQIDVAEMPVRVTRPNKLVFYTVGLGLTCILSLGLAIFVGLRKKSRRCLNE